MEERYNSKKVVEFKKRDSVTLRIPKIDRACTDMPRLACMVVEVHGKTQDSYRLR